MNLFIEIALLEVYSIELVLDADDEEASATHYIITTRDETGMAPITTMQYIVQIDQLEWFCDEQGWDFDEAQSMIKKVYKGAQPSLPN